MPTDRPKIRLIEEDDIDEVMETSAVHEMERIFAPIDAGVSELTRGVQQLRSQAATRILVPDVPHIVMSEVSVHALFQGLHSHLGEKAHKALLATLGERVGQAFGEVFMAFLRKSSYLPRTRQVLFDMWSRYDSGANWGKFQPLVEEEAITIRVEDSFLLRDPRASSHPHCSFVGGYLLGLSWMLVSQYDRWFSQALMPKAAAWSRPLRWRESHTAQSDCVFEIELKQEEMPGAFDTIAEAWESWARGSFREAAMAVRVALEDGLREKVQLETRPKLSLPDQLKVFTRHDTKPAASDVYKRARELWERLSQDVAHSRAGVDESRAKGFLYEAAGILKHLERLEIGRPLREAIRAKLSGKAS